MIRRSLIPAVLLGLLIAWAAARPPSPRGEDAPATAFSAERAMSDVRVIAREPHPTGSAANARVRDHLVQRMAALGLSPRVERMAWRGRTVENITGVLPGFEPAAPAVLLMAHYDSVANSPGAGDDAAGVAAILETVRALRAAGARPTRDVQVLFTDGEEQGLWGAKARFQNGAEGVGVVLNFEARGAAGRTAMFETGPGNAGFVRLWGETAPSPSGSSLARYVYDRMPNGTDFTIPKDLGVPGLNFAFIADEAAYHTPLATPDRLDRGSLQHMGDQMLGLVDALAVAPSLPTSTQDLVFSDVFGLALVAYPAPMGWAPIAIAAALLGVAVWRTRGTPKFGRSLAAGPLRLLLGVLIAALLLAFARLMLGVGEGVPWPVLLANVPWLLTGVVVIVGLSVVVAWSGERTPASGIGALAIGLLLAVVAQALAPETAFVLAWPVLLGALLAAAAPQPGPFSTPTAIVLGAIGLGWIAGLLYQLFLSLGLGMPETLATGALLAPLVLHPLLGRVQAAARR